MANENRKNREKGRRNSKMGVYRKGWIPFKLRRQIEENENKQRRKTDPE